MRRSNNNFPVFVSSCYLIGTSHLRHTQTTNNKANYSRHIFNCCLCFVFVPVSISGTTTNFIRNMLISFGRNCKIWIDLPGRSMISSLLRSSSQEWIVTCIKLILNTIFHNVLENWCPSWHLIGLFSNAFFSLDVVWFFTASLFFYVNISLIFGQFRYRMWYTYVRDYIDS